MSFEIICLSLNCEHKKPSHMIWEFPFLFFLNLYGDKITGIKML
uniref:Uncharacterized protein n=1 Tax=Setaria italica TaxID=4555 RepID=K3ZFU7_SETIT